MEVLVILAIILCALTALYVLRIARDLRPIELFVSGGRSDPDGVIPLVLSEVADVRQGLPLSDFLVPDTGLSGKSAADIAAEDQTRQLELGGQYVQRTNNYRHTYPDNWSGPLSELVGAVYAPRGSLGATVPCDGQC
jgi:hypothetical protein